MPAMPAAAVSSHLKIAGSARVFDRCNLDIIAKLLFERGGERIAVLFVASSATVLNRHGGKSHGKR
jgi:hypothetical protein